MRDRAELKVGTELRKFSRYSKLCLGKGETGVTMVTSHPRAHPSPPPSSDRTTLPDELLQAQGSFLFLNSTCQNLQGTLQ